MQFVARDKKRRSLNADGIMDEYGICAFPETRDNKHLWAFYVDSYKEFVVGNDKERLDTLSDLLLMCCPLRPAAYRDEVLNLDEDNASF